MSSNINWKTFLVSVLGTAIGVALTFSLNGLRAGRQKEYTQRLTAIMVIHDIDMTINELKALRDEEKKFYDYSQFALEHLEDMASVPYDTLTYILQRLTKSDVVFRFDTSKEMMFNSSLDSWHNLGDVKFMDNVQSFYFSRQALQSLFDSSPVWTEPLEEDINYKLFADVGRVSHEEYIKRISSYLSDKLKEKEVRVFVELSDQRIVALNRYIDSWSKMNDENKFLMGITDTEMDDYISSMKENGKPVKAKDLTGTWEYFLEGDNSAEYEFRKDREFVLTDHSSQIWHAQYWSGKFKSKLTISGTWSLQGDSLYMYQDPASVVVELDVSELVAVKGKEDSLATWARNYEEEVRQYQSKELETKGKLAFGARLDPSRDKMKWTRSGKVFYVKRKAL